MKIHAAGIAHTFGRQTRAYAEYRVFSSLAPFSDVVRDAAVSLTPAGAGPAVLCSVVVGFDAGVPVSVTEQGRHAYDAINRAAHRIGPALRGRTG
jgi:hypothetical protein